MIGYLHCLNIFPSKLLLNYKEKDDNLETDETGKYLLTQVMKINDTVVKQIDITHLLIDSLRTQHHSVYSCPFYFPYRIYLNAT